MFIIRYSINLNISKDYCDFSLICTFQKILVFIGKNKFYNSTYNIQFN